MPGFAKSFSDLMPFGVAFANQDNRDKIADGFASQNMFLLLNLPDIELSAGQEEVALLAQNDLCH